MKLTKAIAIAILLLMPLSYPTVTQASNDEITIAIYPTVEDSEHSTSAQQLLEAISNRLADHEIVLKVDYLERDEQPDDSAATVAFLDRIYVTPQKSPLQQLSPVLADTELAISFEPIEVAADMLAGFLLYLEGDCKSAQTYWEQVVGSTRTQDDDAQIIVLQGNCALLQGDYAEAISIYESAEELADVESESFNLAWAYLQVGKPEVALEMADHLIEMVASNPLNQVVGLVKRSQLHALAFHFDEAIADMTAAIEIAENNSDFTAEYMAYLYTERGQRILLTYEWDRVLADYNRAIELDPEYAPAYFHRGVLFYTQGPRENALPDFRRYLELAPEGEFADEATRAIESIEAELEALSE